jgi:hypothetical protein
MGCGDSAENKAAHSVEAQFAEMRLNNLLTMQFESQIEEGIFKAVNVCRMKPSLFVPIVHQVKSKAFPAAQKAPHTHVLLKMLKSMQRLPPIAMDEQAFKVVRQNNDRVIAMDQPVPSPGGNTVLFQQMFG